MKIATILHFVRAVTIGTALALILIATNVMCARTVTVCVKISPSTFSYKYSRKHGVVYEDTSRHQFSCKYSRKHRVVCEDTRKWKLIKHCLKYSQYVSIILRKQND